jgi:tetratricopeptide (TPR) repeat protein
MGRARRPLAPAGGWALLLILLVGMAAHPAPATAHPDLLEQIAQLNVQLAAQPGDAELLARRGDLYRQHGDATAAQRDFAAARSTAPDLAVLDLQEGRLMLEQGNPAAAQQLLASYLARQPEQALAWSLSGHAHLALMQPEQAAKDFGRAIRNSIHPSPGLFRDQVLALLAAGHEHWDAAQRTLDSALLQHPADIALLGLATDISLAQDQPGEALALIAHLRPELQALPQWRERERLAKCLKDDGSEAETVEACRSTVLEHLATQAVVPH